MRQAGKPAERPNLVMGKKYAGLLAQVRALLGYRKSARFRLAGQIADLGPFELVSRGTDLPVFAWTSKQEAHWSLYDLADRLRDRVWQVPAYRMPANRQQMVVEHVVVRNGFTCDLAGMLVKDIRRHLDWFATQPGLRPKAEGSQFHH